MSYKTDIRFKPITPTRYTLYPESSVNYGLTVDKTRRARLLDRIITAKIDRKNYNHISQSRVHQHSRLDTMTNSQNNWIRSPRFGQPIKIESRLVVPVRTQPNFYQQSSQAKPIQIFLDNDISRRWDVSPSFSRTVKEQSMRNATRSFGTQSNRKRDPSKQKINLANRSKCMDYRHDDNEERGSWLSPFVNLIESLNTRDDGCMCGEHCPWAAKFVRWAAQEGPKDRNKFYQNLSRSETNAEIATQVEKDIKRTFSNVPTFTTDRFRSMLRSILLNYSKYDREVLYVQGMNVVVAGLLYHIKEEEATFWVFCKIMEKIQVRTLFLGKFEAAFEHIKTIKKYLEHNINDLYRHIQSHQIEFQAFCVPWLLSIFTNLMDIKYVHIVYDGMIKEGWVFLYRLATSYLLFLKRDIMEQTEGTDILVILSSSYANRIFIPWQRLAECGRRIEEPQ